MSTTQTTLQTPFRLASRLDEVGFSDIVKIRNKVMELRSKGEQVFQFEGGEPFLNTPEHIKTAAHKAIEENKTRYAPSSGIPDLRNAIATKLRERNRIQVEVDDVIVLNGGMQGLFGAFQTTVNPTDEFLVFSPYWTPIRDLISMCQGHQVLVSTEEARREGFEKTLLKHLTEKTRGIYYNTPTNPNGIVFTREEAEAVSRFVIEHNLIVVADEAYEDLVYDGEHVSIASIDGMAERTITSFTLSKSYSMTGWRIGYAVAKEPWMTGLKKTLLYSTNGVSTPTQWAAVEAINTAQDFFEPLRASYKERRDLMITGLNELGLTCVAPDGAFYAFPDVTSINEDSRKAADILLERAKVATVPGVVFGRHGEGHLRFSFSTSIENIQAGLESLRKNL